MMNFYVDFLFSAAATGPTYPAQQSGYAVAQPAAAYGPQRPAGFDPAAYQATAASQGTYAGRSIVNFVLKSNWNMSSRHSYRCIRMK